MEQYHTTDILIRAFCAAKMSVNNGSKDMYTGMADSELNLCTIRLIWYVIAEMVVSKSATFT